MGEALNGSQGLLRELFQNDCADGVFANGDSFIPGAWPLER